jgi:hypothetical protein
MGLTAFEAMHNWRTYKVTAAKIVGLNMQHSARQL